MKFVHALFAAFIAALLAACGGGAYEASAPPFASVADVAKKYDDTPFVFNRSVFDSIIGTDEAGYRVIISEDGQVLYDKTMPDFGYQAGVLADGTRVRLISEFKVADDFPSAQWLFVGSQKFALPNTATFDGKPHQVIVDDISEGGGEWLILSFTDITDALSEDGSGYSYWAVINRHNGAVVEYGYYDESSDDMDAVQAAKRTFGSAIARLSRLSVTQAATRR